VRGSYATLRASYFVVHYDPSDPYLAKLMAGIARDELRRISRDLGYKPEPDRPFPIYIYRTHYAFIEAGGLKERKFTVGTANSANEAISVDASGVFALPKEIIAHEVTHAVIFRILGPSVAALPLWVNEGLAKYESEEFSDKDDTILANAASDGTLLALSVLTRTFPDDQNDVAYASSASAMRYMVKKYGKNSPRTLLRELARTGSFDKAMLKATGRTGGRFADEWFAKTGRKYLSLRITRLLTGGLMTFMAILAIVAFLVRRKQKREAARQWEQEEFEDYLRRELGDR
jgi:hypothetical protein